MVALTFVLLLFIGFVVFVRSCSDAEPVDLFCAGVLFATCLIVIMGGARI